MTSRARGVDISSVQGHCDFQKLKEGVFDFVIIKATSGGAGRDPMFHTYIEAARGAGLLVPLVYHVLTNQAPIQQQVSNALSAAYPYEVDIALDFELPYPGMSQTQVCERARDFAKGVTSSGQRVCTYSYPYFMKSLRGQPALGELASLTTYWAADYPHERVEPNDQEHPWVPEEWNNQWLFWQWSGNKGTGAPGIPAIVDHVLFNGTVEELKAWMSPTNPNVAPGY